MMPSPWSAAYRSTSSSTCAGGSLPPTTPSSPPKRTLLRRPPMSQRAAAVTPPPLPQKRTNCHRCTEAVSSRHLDVLLGRVLLRVVNGPEEPGTAGQFNTAPGVQIPLF
ncbi:hypothetical protein GN956_G18326 [Arapaima gigas]